MDRYSVLEPVQGPISPAYEEAVKRRRGYQAEPSSSSSTSVLPKSDPPTVTSTMDVTLNFGGGAELLVGGKKQQIIPLPTGSSIKNLLEWMISDHGVVKERPELLILNDDVRPGILVLINDTDWELCDKTVYLLQPGDEVTFISTLHGG